MNIIVKGKNLEITPALRTYAEKKVSKLERFFNGDRLEMTAEVMMIIERESGIVEITLEVDGLLLRGEDQSQDMYGSIDGAIEKIERQIRKYKTKIHRKFQDAPRISELQPGEDDAGAPEEKNIPRVVKTKRFAIKPMSVEEAVMQMDLLGHDFYVFTNAYTEEVNVLYRRRDGDFGLIEPEYE